MTSSLSAQPSLKRGRKALITQRQVACFEKSTSQRQANTLGSKWLRGNLKVHLKFRQRGKEESTVMETCNEQSDWFQAESSLTHLERWGFILVPLERVFGQSFWCDAFTTEEILPYLGCPVRDGNWKNQYRCKGNWARILGVLQKRSQHAWILQLEE